MYMEWTKVLFSSLLNSLSELRHSLPVSYLTNLIIISLNIKLTSSRFILFTYSRNWANLPSGQDTQDYSLTTTYFIRENHKAVTKKKSRTIKPASWVLGRLWVPVWTKAISWVWIWVSINGHPRGGLHGGGGILRRGEHWVGWHWAGSHVTVFLGLSLLDRSKLGRRHGFWFFILEKNIGIHCSVPPQRQRSTYAWSINTYQLIFMNKITKWTDAVFLVFLTK